MWQSQDLRNLNEQNLSSNFYNPVYTGPPLEVDLNLDSDHVVQVDWAIRIVIWIDCVYTELIPELVLEKWSHVNRA